ncbi:hypothetical protein FJZ31_16360 [Candidatus Poribacteria bacterium]|nr:hypothetical protein [Candidatus Poribacteria bacterium]
MNNLQLIRNRKSKPLTFSLLFLTIVLCISTIADGIDHQASKTSFVTYIFGKVEVLRSDSSEWEFLKKNAQLSSDDLIRMPPISLLRIKEKGGAALPAFYGSRELRVSQLIAEGKERMATSRGKRLDTDLDGGMAIDILPTGNPDVASATRTLANSATKDPQTLKVTPTELQQLRSLLQNPSDALKASALSKLEQISGFQPKADLSRGRSEQTDNNPMREITVYPGKNILQAQCLFDALRTEFGAQGLASGIVNFNSEIRNPKSEIRFMALYGQMLQSIGIKVDFITNSKDELFLIFDSGRNIDKIGRITANRALVYSNNPNLWIPVSISDISNNFTYAWYKGSQLANEE